jgi:hypothetical protein
VLWSLIGEAGRDPLPLKGFERLWMGVGGGSDLGGCSGGADVSVSPTGCGFAARDCRSLTYRSMRGKRSFLYPGVY